MLCQPLAGRRRVNVTNRRTRIDWAQQIKELVDVHYPQALRITLVLDNLNTHAMASLYETFEPSEARRLVEKLEVIYTPKHGSWLNVAEIELSALGRQCTEGRVPDQPTLAMLTRAWERDRNNRGISVDWQFTTDDARIRLRRLYPQLSA